MNCAARRWRTLCILVGLGTVLGGGLVVALRARVDRRGGCRSAAGANVQVSQAGAAAIASRSAGGRKARAGAGSGARTTRSAALNALSNQSRAAALALATRGEVFDLGLTYSRRSFKWPGHSPGEIITFRSPDGVHRMKDPDAPPAAQEPGPRLLAFGRAVHLG